MLQNKKHFLLALALLCAYVSADPTPEILAEASAIIDQEKDSQACLETKMAMLEAQAKQTQRTSTRFTRALTTCFGISEYELTNKKNLLKTIPAISTIISSYLLNLAKEPTPRKETLLRAIAVGAHKISKKNTLLSEKPDGFNFKNNYLSIAALIISPLLSGKLCNIAKLIHLWSYIKMISTSKQVLKTLLKRKIIILSRTVPRNMRDKRYLVFTSPLTIAIQELPKTHSLLFPLDYKNENRHSPNTAVTIYPLLILILSKIIPWGPHAYILKTDYDTLPIELKKSLYEQVVVSTVSGYAHLVETSLLALKAISKK